MMMMMMMILRYFVNRPPGLALPWVTRS